MVVDFGSRGTTEVSLNTHKDLFDSDMFELLAESFGRFEELGPLRGVKRDAEETNDEEGESPVDWWNTSSWYIESVSQCSNTTSHMCFLFVCRTFPTTSEDALSDLPHHRTTPRISTSINFSVRSITYTPSLPSTSYA